VSAPPPLSATWQHADDLRAQGNFVAARDLLEPAVDVACAQLGLDDPAVVETQRRLATVHREMGELPAARRVLEEALDGGLLGLGDADPLILLISAELGAIADELGNKHEARRNLARVAHYGPTVLGPDHPYVRTSLRYLGVDVPPLQATTAPAEPVDAPPAEPVQPPPPEPAVVAVEPGVYRPAPRDELAPLAPLTGDATAPHAEAPTPHAEAPAPAGPGVYRPPAPSGPAGDPAPATPSPIAPSPIAPSPIAPSPTAPAPTASSQVAPAPTASSPVAPAPTGRPEVAPSRITPSPTAPAPSPPSPAAPAPTGRPEVAADYGAADYGDLPGQTGTMPGPVPGQRPAAGFAGGPADPATAEPYDWASPTVGQWVPPSRRERDAGERRPTRGPLIAMALITLVVVVAGVAIGLVLFHRGTPSAGSPSATASSAPARLAPGHVQLRDDGVSVTLTWSDPTAGRVPFVVAGGRAGETSRALQTLPPGSTAYTLNGLNPALNYCFTVVAVYTTNEVATSALTCTQRGAHPTASAS
jgi:hypothetical protein